MAYFPFMIDLEKKRCVIAGAGKVAVRKAEQMIEFGADVTVVAPDICVQMRTFFEGKKNQMCLIQRKITKEDIVSADVVIMATNQPAVNEEMAAFCKKGLRILFSGNYKRGECCHFCINRWVQSASCV